MPSLDIAPDNDLAMEGVLKKLIDSLLLHLAREISLYEELREIVCAEREMAQRPSLDSLQSGNNKREACIVKARTLEDARMKIIKKLAAFFNQKEEVINISFLLPHVEEGQREKLRLRQERLSALIAEVRKAQETNRNVVAFLLSRVKSSLDFINDLQGMKSGYLKSGKMRSGRQNGVMLSQEA
jgi:hypothetical protein